ncbi:hypothetical protein AKJ57_00745 [candidate division MSBL1 archaeon SCGC-AAA259A05]|uniref:Uncharacterized protein n=1 Tax=candidate division MSBL1 archaeon SCGC-AAA259A05 TaxID=1698259 RepID=A0A133UBK1_9EURY|nr:hypothetical protein AKJ57_00745 [candidate division MSBL1 archaeon SCGC-AAA259A05]
MSSTYGKRRKLLATSLPIGLTLVGISIGLTHVLSLPPLYLCVLLLALTYLAGKTISVKTKRRPKQKEVSIQEKPTDFEIKNMLKKRGLEGLIRDSKEEN